MSNPAEGNGRAARRPPPLLIQWVGPPPAPERPFGLLRLALGPEVCCYFIEPVPSDFGRAFSVTKLEAADEVPVYHVLLDGRRSSCDCLGHQRHGHCKHLDALCMLVEQGQLPEPRR
jgi:hypothetical protein